MIMPTKSDFHDHSDLFVTKNSHLYSYSMLQCTFSTGPPEFDFLVTHRQLVGLLPIQILIAAPGCRKVQLNIRVCLKVTWQVPAAAKGVMEVMVRPEQALIFAHVHVHACMLAHAYIYMTYIHHITAHALHILRALHTLQSNSRSNSALSTISNNNHCASK